MPYNLLSILNWSWANSCFKTSLKIPNGYIEEQTTQWTNEEQTTQWTNEEQTTQWTNEEQTTQWINEEQTTQWTNEKVQKDNDLQNIHIKLKIE